MLSHRARCQFNGIDVKRGREAAVRLQPLVGQPHGLESVETTFISPLLVGPDPFLRTDDRINLVAKPLHAFGSTIAHFDDVNRLGHRRRRDGYDCFGHISDWTVTASLGRGIETRVIECAPQFGEPSGGQLRCGRAQRAHAPAALVLDDSISRDFYDVVRARTEAAGSFHPEPCRRGRRRPSRRSRRSRKRPLRRRDRRLPSCTAHRHKRPREHHAQLHVCPTIPAPSGEREGGETTDAFRNGQLGSNLPVAPPKWRDDLAVS